MPKEPTDKVVGQAEIAHEMNVGVRQVQHYKRAGAFDLMETIGGKDAYTVQSLWAVQDRIDAAILDKRAEAGRASGIVRAGKTHPGAASAITSATVAKSDD